MDRWSMLETESAKRVGQVYVASLVLALERIDLKVISSCSGEYSWPPNPETASVHVIIDITESSSYGLRQLYKALAKLNSYTSTKDRHGGAGKWVLEPVQIGDDIHFKLHPEDNNWATPLAEYRREAARIAAQIEGRSEQEFTPMSALEAARKLLFS